MKKHARFSASALQGGFLLAAATVLALGCPMEPKGVNIKGGSTTTGAAPVLALEGAVEVDGSSTVYPISEAAAAEFKKTYPGVKVSVGKSGTGGGFKRFVTGETDISDASRPIKKDELDEATANGVEFIELPVAYDGLTIVVHPKADWVDQITVEQLQKIFLAGDSAKTWKDVDESWPDEEIKIYSPGTDSGTYDYFKEVVAGKEGALRDDMSLSEDDNNLVRGVEGNQYAIGYFGAAYYFGEKERLKALKVVNPETGEAVAVDPVTVKNGDYAPFSRPLFIYVNVDKLSQPQVEEFVHFYLDQAGKLAEKVGYVELPDAVYESCHAHFEDRQTGSHYYDESGAERTGTLEELFVTDATHAE